MAICNGESGWAFGNDCVRDVWTTLTPAAFIVLVCIVSVPLPSQIRTATSLFRGVFNSFLTLSEAEAYEKGTSPLEEFSKEHETASVWRMFIVSWIAIAETIFWIGLGCYRLTSGDADQEIWDVCGPVIVAISWLYAAIRPILRPTATPPYDLLIFYVLESISAITRFGSIFFKHDVYGDPLPNAASLVAVCMDFAAILCLISVVMSMPLAIPSQRIDKSQIVCFTFNHSDSPCFLCLNVNAGLLNFT